MKRLIKSVLGKAWGWTTIVRRPLVSRFDQRLELMLGQTVRDPIAQHLHAINVAHHEMNIALNSCVREIARLEMQIEELRLELDRERSASPIEEVTVDSY